ncbi:SHOCT-like domain-containing protein, partial [Salinispira pacifica]
MNEERTMILKMLKDGKITIEEAEALMEVIEESERTEAEKGAGESESGTGSANSARNADSARNANSTRGAKGPRPESGGSGQEEW